tara:strand:- start:159 stop:1097 length:939 start_codon:yes stop_codon:yes gene_type:complete
MDKILITGGLGYLGSMIATKLVYLGFNVTVVDNISFKRQSLKHLFIYKNFKFINSDVRDLNQMKKIYKKYDYIFPLAALVGAPFCDKYKNKAIEVNEIAIKDMIKNISKNQRVIFPNTNSGYGISKIKKPCTEEMPLNPISLYGITKKNAENAILQHTNHISLRLATVFGLGYRNRNDLLVNYLIYEAINTKKLEIYEPHFRRNFIHIRDIADTFIFCLENFNYLKNNIYNVGLSKANLTKYELCLRIKKHIKDLKISIIKKGKDIDKRDYFVSNKKLERKGWKPKIDLDSGIKEVIKGYSNYSKNDFEKNY